MKHNRYLGYGLYLILGLIMLWIVGCAESGKKKSEGGTLIT